MEPFTIQCSTCQSLIRVRNPKMIGQIVNCPKCNSMLQITDPRTIDSRPSDARQIRVESHRGVIDSSAMTKEAFAPELEDEYRLAPSQVAEPELSSAAALVAPPRVEEQPAFQEAFAAPPLPERMVTSPQPTEPNNIQLLAVRRTARRRQVLMIAVFGSSGVLLAGVLFTGFLYWYTSSGKSKSTIAKNPANLNSDVKEPKHVGPKLEREQDLASDPLADPELDPLAEPTSAEGNLPADLESADDKKTIGSAVANAIANPNVPESSPGPTNPGPLNPATPNQAVTESEQPTAPKNAADDKSADGAATELPEQLKKFQSILNTSIEPQFMEDQAVQKAPPTAKELGLSAGADSKALPAADVGKQLQFEITGLIVPPGSISNAVSQWVQVSGVPTVVDLDSLVAAGIDRYKPLPRILFGESRPLSQIGEAIAKQIGVDFKVIDNRFLAFQASEEAIRAQMPTSIKISDLLADSDQQQWLVKTLDQIWPEYEGKWIIQDGELKVDPVAVDAYAWFWAVRMLESWRQAAGVETQLDKTKFDQSKFVTKFVDLEQLEGLNKPLRMALINRAPVAQIVSEICAANQMHAWVDWASVGQKGLGPSTVDFVVTPNRKLRQCLRDIAEKYSVVVACEDDKSVIITTAEVYRGQPRLYVLPSQGKTAEQWMDELQPLTPISAQGAAQPVQAYLTPDSRFVIVRCCRPQIRS